MLSVVIPLYNKAATIERAIRSVLTQTIQDFELIVVNNGSTDGGGEIVNQIQDPRLRLIEQETPGVSLARNKGIEEANGEWVAFLDADDEWKPTFLETVLALKQQYPDCSVLATAYQRCDANGTIQDIQLGGLPNRTDILTTGQTAMRLDNYFEVAALSDPPFCSICVMAQKSALQSIGGFPIDIYQGEDLLTWARLAANYKIAYCPEPLSVFYTGEQSSMDCPKRIPTDNDIVGRELEEMYRNNPDQGLKQYIAKWHKMRASIYLRLPNMATKCRQEIKISQRWHHNNKLYSYLILSYIPYPIRMQLLKKIA